MTTSSTSWAVRIHRAAAEFDWAGVDAVATEYEAHLRAAARPASDDEFAPVLQLLRSNRRYTAMTRVVDALLSQGVSDALVRRHYGQALIEQGYPAAARITLAALIGDESVPPAEQVEARGLLGRCGKELFLGTTDPVRRADYLRSALGTYLEAYHEQPGERFWSGINAVALLARAVDEQVPLEGHPDARAALRELVTDVLDVVRDRPDDDGWAQATAVEAHVAVGEHAQAVERLEALITMARPDAFALNSLLRQLTVVWRLDTESAPGSSLLPLLRSELLRKSGGFVSVTPQDVGAERLERLSSPGLEKVFGSDRYVTLSWYVKGLTRCRAVARLETPDEEGLGTGFLVRGADFHTRLPAVLLMTNGHVVPEAIDADQVVVAFHAADAGHSDPQRFRVVRQWFYDSSQAPHLDTTLLELDGLPVATEPVPVSTRLPALGADVTPRAYVIGHPMGLEQPQFSLQDNRILGYSDHLIHYRSPTDPGSSGSPVFDRHWNLIGLHHSGSSSMARLDGQPGVYAANEGIRVSAVRTALHERWPAGSPTGG
ncbi:serine protease [Terrabacter sp. NPDC000476]|uniref:serine protease n=1 Tax=Terrabacter sp. NPDC000476 TaxID=3154258 RepID=UPI003326BA4A